MERHVLRADASIRRLLGEVVAGLAGGKGDDHVRILGLDALDDAGIVLGIA